MLPRRSYRAQKLPWPRLRSPRWPRRSPLRQTQRHRHPSRHRRQRHGHRRHRKLHPLRRSRPSHEQHRQHYVPQTPRNRSRRPCCHQNRQRNQTQTRYAHNPNGLMFKVAVLASTNGTDLQAIIDELKSGQMPGIELVGVFSNKQCYAIERAAAQGYHTHICPTEPELIAALEKYQPDLIVLVGYMRVLTKTFLQKFPKVINVHPSLIPKYSGKNFYGQSVHEAVLQNKESETGMTIHYVDQGVDTGQIILQKTCPVHPDDTPETLKARVQELEKKWYPEVIRNLAS